MLVIGKKGIGYPDFFGEIASQRHCVVTVLVRREGKAIVDPVLVQVDGDGVVLQNTPWNLIIEHIIRHR